MKTKELIRQLQENDPSGELDACVGNCDIFFVERLPAYYDGCQQILIRDETNPYYNVIGGKYKSTGRKVNIQTLSFRDVIWDHPEIAIDYSDLSGDKAKRYKESNEKQAQESRDFFEKSELEYFIKHLRKRALEENEELYDLDEAAKEFFAKNLKSTDPIPADIPTEYESYVTRRDKQWLREITLTWNGNNWILSKSY